MSRLPGIVPEVTELTAPYWEGARAGRLMAQRCRACGAVWHPPHPTCTSCQSDDVTWEELQGTGHLYSYTIVHHAAHPAVADDLPYIVALVELSEGPLMISTILAEPDELRTGAELRVTFLEIPNSDFCLPAFNLAN